MALEVGSRIAHYDVTALIGEGGMGQVYQATDTKLNRQVALKILPEAFATDPDRLARFQREAQVLASLNHPGIAAIYGIEESDDTRALVLELVEGPTLAERISKGPIPIDEALPIAKQIAEALEAAHEAGVIHRDLKPANIKVREDGTVKVLDFGLAKAFQPDASDPSMSQSPTISLTAAATQMGMVIGTAAYMAPEQASGKVVDKRADVWAFGVVLYEMLTGTTPFFGDDVLKTLARVIDREPDWSVLPSKMPPVLGKFLRGCLVKNPRERLRDIGDVGLALKGMFEVGRISQLELRPSPLQVWQRPIPASLGSLVFLAVGGLAVWALLGSSTQVSPEPMRFTLTLPDRDQLARGSGGMLALSPDGRTLAYRARRDGIFQLSRRPIDRFDGVPIPGTEGAGSPFFSPDGQWVGFAANGSLLKVALAGGPPQTLTAIASSIRGAHWGADNEIIYGLNTPGGALMQVSAAGGETVPIFIPDDERRSWYPQVLPEKDAVLFTLSHNGPDAGELHLLIRETGEHRTLMLNAVAGRILDTGHLVFVRNGALWAVPFDRHRLDIVGEAVPVLEGVRVENGGPVQYALADDGSLVYIPGDIGGGGTRRGLVWVDSTGEQPVSVPPREYQSVSLSPDGSRAAVAIFNDVGTVDIWVSELARGTLTRLTTAEVSRAEQN